jgi:hypothetical protein
VLVYVCALALAVAVTPAARSEAAALVRLNLLLVRPACCSRLKDALIIMMTHIESMCEIEIACVDALFVSARYTCRTHEPCCTVSSEGLCTSMCTSISTGLCLSTQHLLCLQAMLYGLALVAALGVALSWLRSRLFCWAVQRIQAAPQGQRLQEVICLHGQWQVSGRAGGVGVGGGGGGGPPTGFAVRASAS